MTFELSDIVRRINEDAAGYVRECEDRYDSSVRRAAALIFDNLDKSNVVLLSGPSGSGKTTTAKRMTAALDRLGITAHTVSLDNYFLTIDPETAPRNPQGEIDYESPSCLDLELLNKHFDSLEKGEEIHIPHFDFSRQRRSPDRYTPMKLHGNEIAIFEGIHALNDCITYEHPNAFKLYVSTESDIVSSGAPVVEGKHLRLVRRLIRDDLFRGADPVFTLGMWDNIRRGEELHIKPYKGSADVIIDSTLPYEPSVMKQVFGQLFSRVPEDTEHYDILNKVVTAFPLFPDIDPILVPQDSILREFIGGSSIKY